MTNQRCHIIAPVVLLIFAIVGILLLALSTDNVRIPPDYMYGIVLDAGSSHTAMYVYKWPADKQNDTGIVTQHDECHVKGGGISSYAGKRGEAGRSLEACLTQAKEVIPKSRHHLSPLYLGATAGMRLLNLTNNTESDEILKEVRAKMKAYPFKFRGATILSGQEEGAYGWVTVNYMLENFIKYDFVGEWLIPKRKTVGALDFGGASTQITFQTKDTVEDQNNAMTLRLYGQNYSLYTQSFLCYGRDQVLRQLLAHLHQAQGLSGAITHPCYPSAYNVSMKLSQIFDSPCTKSKAPLQYNGQDTLEVVGSGHYQHCLQNMSRIFTFEKCSFSKCSFNGVFQPNVTGSFMAFSAFYYIYSFLERTTGITLTSPSLLEEAVQAVCNMSMDEMLVKAPDQKGRLQDYCAASVFVQVLMLQAYGFDDQSFSQISFQKTIEGTSVGWALGYMLSLSSLLPGESVGLRKALRSEAWAALLVLFVFLLLIVLGYLLLKAYQRKGSSSAVI
ncbi:ectonucleoside triphosphate diphosphohydrolase 2 [Clupea harengus]|uniref:Ectonucleoside triphosphate diphosphohydrolase 2 n=1 Tax=Clupea harengus TaxID=7950 RepID=A0A6P8FRN4_CLUHA|nr:ectonucleoside triphosphate diphosphohydrolase 2 [Clupea harengus]